jgi:hypothetical protein
MQNSNNNNNVFISDPKTPVNSLICPPNVVKIYDDAEKYKLDILKDCKDKSIIYMWYNKVNGKVYVGSAYRGSVRLNYYFLYCFLKRTSSRIYPSILKYGHSNFSLVILKV